MGTKARRAAAVGACVSASALGLMSCGGQAQPELTRARPAPVVDVQTPDVPSGAEPDVSPAPAPHVVASPAVYAARPARPRVVVATPRPRPRQDGLFTIEIPRLGLVARVHEGQSAAVLTQGPGHTPGSAMPGQRGNVVIPGHRTVAPHPFQDIDVLRPGDVIVLVGDEGRFVYQVTGSTVVDAADGGVAEPTPDPIVTIYACHPKGSDAERYVVFGRLVTAPSDAPPPAGSAGRAPPQAQSTPPAPNRGRSTPICGLVPCSRR